MGFFLAVHLSVQPLRKPPRAVAAKPPPRQRTEAVCLSEARTHDVRAGDVPPGRRLTPFRNSRRASLVDHKTKNQM